MRVAQIFLAGIFFFAIGVYAKEHVPIDEDASAPPPSSRHHPGSWHGSNVQLGALINTGNTESTHIHSGLYAIYQRHRWHNVTEFKSQFAEDSGNVSKEKYYFQNQFNFNFLGGHHVGYRNYIFINENLKVDKFSPYRYQAIVAAGYGRDLIKTRRFIFSVQAGPGYRRNKIRDTKITENNFIFTTKATAKWLVTKSGELSQMLRYDMGQSFNYFKSVSAFTNKIVTHWSLQVGYTVEQYSKIPLGSTKKQKKDTTTYISLVYNF